MNEPTHTTEGLRIINAAIEKAVVNGEGASLYDSTIMRHVKSMTRAEILAAINGVAPNDKGSELAPQNL